MTKPWPGTKRKTGTATPPPIDGSATLNVSRYIARQYLSRNGGRSASVIRIISRIAALGIVVTAAALIVVLSGFAGLRDFNLRLMDQTGPDLRIVPRQGKTLLLTDSLRRRLSASGDFKAVAPVIEEKVYVRYGDKQAVAYMRGIDSNYLHVINGDSILIAGRWPEPDFPGMVMGNALAEKLSVSLNDFSRPVELMIPVTGRSWTSASFRKNDFMLTGIYQNTLDQELKYLYVPAPFARQLLHKEPGRVSYVDLELNRKQDLERVKQKWAGRLPPGWKLLDKYQMNRSLIKMLNSENLITYVVGTFIMIIALFNIVGTIIMMILYKKRDRYILSALGMAPGQIRRIFFHYGWMMIMAGGMAGLVLGILIVLMQLHFQWVKVPGTTLVYPVALRWTNVLLVWATVALLAWGAAWFASRLAGRHENLRP